ncbi:hypothetical protein D3C87_1864920 [compost metagenome]
MQDQRGNVGIVIRQLPPARRPGLVGDADEGDIARRKGLDRLQFHRRQLRCLAWASHHWPHIEPKLAFD